MKKKIVGLLVGLTLALSLTACGGSDSSSSSSDSSAASTTTAAEADASADDAADEAEVEADVEEESDDFTLLDVDSSMIEIGVYAVDENGNELVLTLFTEPSGTPLVSLFVFDADGTGDVICGTYESESVTDEDGIDWTVLEVEDIYTGGAFELGVCEADDGSIAFFDNAGNVYEGEYLDAEDTIDYMAAAVVLLDEQ